MYTIFVIIPTYNRANLVTRAIQSVLNNQGNYTFKIIVIDDGSTDDTQEKIKPYLDSYPSSIHYKYKENGGNGTAKNLGISSALQESGDPENDMLLFLDSDDALVPNAFSYIHNQKDTNTKIISFAFSTEDKYGKSMTHIDKDNSILTFEEILSGKYLRGETLNCANISLFQNKDFRFDEEINGGETLLLWNIYKNIKTLFSKKVLRIYYKDAENSLLRSALTQKNMVNIYKMKKKIIDKFGEDLSRINKKTLGSSFLVLARAAVLTGKRKEGAIFFIKGIKRNPLDIKRIFLYFISNIDYQLQINNFLLRYFSD